MPLAYVPAMYFPINRENRATGFLLPVYGNSTLRGHSISNAFFWAIDRSQDLTILSRLVLEDRLGLRLGVPLRGGGGIAAATCAPIVSARRRCRRRPASPPIRPAPRCAAASCRRCRAAFALRGERRLLHQPHGAAAISRRRLRLVAADAILAGAGERTARTWQHAQRDVRAQRGLLRNRSVADGRRRAAPAVHARADAAGAHALLRLALVGVREARLHAHAPPTRTTTRASRASTSRRRFRFRSPRGRS